MSILAGVVCRRPDAPLRDATCDAVRRALARGTGGVVSEFRDERAFLAKLDIRAFGEPAFIAPPGGPISMLAGEPLLAVGEPHAARARSKDLELLHRRWALGDWSLLTTARGVFCGVHYDPGTACLSLIADKLSIRPLYYWIDDEYVVYATALRILEVLPDVPKRMDTRAVTEMACLGVPLGDRTPYDRVRALRAAEIVHVAEAGVRRTQYWRWDDIRPVDRPEPGLLLTAYERFTAAVACRLREDTATTAFLSGGLDSRCVVAALQSRGVRVRSVNFGFPGTQDQVFGAGFAQASSTEHVHVPMKLEVEPRFSMMMADALQASPAPLSHPERPRVVWSGEGGSLGVGHIYQTRQMVELLRAGRDDDAIATFLEQQRAHVVRHVLRRDVAAALASVPFLGIREELANLRCVDRGRAIHLFLLLNDQRRHLANHFEDIDLHRLEYQLPFFDSDFLHAILEAPIDLCLYHGLYVRWLDLFPPAVTAVPWQSYPGHVPCPLPLPDGLYYQWNANRIRSFRERRKRELVRRANELLGSEPFPRDLLSKTVLRLASWVYRAGLRDYGYLIRHASLYYTYWARCSGRWVAPAVGSPLRPQRPARSGIRQTTHAVSR